MVKNTTKPWASFDLAVNFSAQMRSPRKIWALCWAICTVTFTKPVQAGCADHLSREKYDATVEWKGHCYTYHERLVFCKGVFELCEDLNGFVPKIISLEHQRHIYREIAKDFFRGNVNLGFNFWIGLKYDKTTGDWKWANGDPVTWTNWKSRPDKNNCMAVGDMDGTWTEHAHPYFTDGYMCEIRKPLKPTTTFNPTTPPPSTTRMAFTTRTTASAKTMAAAATHVATGITTAVPETSTQTTSISTTVKPTEITLQRTNPATGDPITKRASYFVEKRGLGKHPYMSAKPNAVVTSWTMLSCCTKCMLLPGCWLVNYSLVCKTCRLYINQDALEQVEQEIGWSVFVAKFD